jgi:ankyrin repeat protein
MFDWSESLNELVLGGLPKLAWQLVPNARKRQILARLRELDRSRKVEQNHDLVRAMRLAWVEATEQILNEAGVVVRAAPHDAHRDFTAFESVLRSELRTIRHVALARTDPAKLPPSPIDRHVDDIVRGVPQTLASDETTDFQRNIDRGFAALLAELTGWSCDEIPAVVIAQARGLGDRRDFGRIVFDAFAALMKSPDAYPEARAAFDIVRQEATDALARRTLDLVGSLEDDVRRLLDPAFFRTIDELSEHMTDVVEMLRGKKATGVFDIANKFPEPTPGTVFVIGEESGRTRFDALAEQMTYVIDRTAPDIDFAPYFWRCDEAERLLALEPALLDRLVTSLSDATSIATVLMPSPDLGRPLTLDEAQRELVERADLVARADRSGIVLDWPERSGERDALLSAGHLPPTLRTLAFAASLVAGRPVWLLTEGEAGTAIHSNFQALVRERAFVVRLASHTDGSWLDGFIGRIVAGDSFQAENPYRFLGYYDVEDANHFFGREPEAVMLRQLLAPSDGRTPPTVVAISGPSGAGKSSFLRAHVMARSAGSDDFGVVVRPTDLQGESGHAENALARLLGAVATQTGLAIDTATLARLPPSAAARTAVSMLTAALSPKGGRRRRLIVALDQFEEILDDLATETSVAEWRTLIDFVDRLIAGGRALVFVTLEDSRASLPARLLAGSPLATPAILTLGDISDTFLWEIVTRPFLCAGFDLSGEVVTQIVSEVRQVETPSADGTGVVGSILPLLSLKLSLLYERLAPLRRSARVVAIGLEELARIDRPLESEIEALAEHAWISIADDPQDLVEFESFIRRFVRLSLDRVDASGRATIVLQTVALDEKLRSDKATAAFRRDRLLVPAAGGLRLVHEAVIRRWRRAREWFVQRREGLRIEAEMRLEARIWDARGRRPVTRVDDEVIGWAADILGDKIREWSGRRTLPVDDALLRDFCLDRFAHSQTPRRPLDTCAIGKAHVHIAAQYDLVDLLERFAAIDHESLSTLRTSHGYTPLQLASWDAAGAVRFLLAAGVDPKGRSADGFSPLDVGVCNGAIEIVEVLLEHGAGGPLADDVPINPISMAAMRGDLAMIRRLQAAGFDPTTPRRGWPPIASAVVSGHAEVVRWFLDNFEPAIMEKSSLLHQAAHAGRHAVIREILAVPTAFPMVDQTDAAGVTPLMIAVDRAEPKSVEVLVYCADPEVRVPAGFEKAGWSALDFAVDGAVTGHVGSPHRKAATLAVLKTLLDAPGYNVFARADDGETPFTRASKVPSIAALLRAHPSFTLAELDPDDWPELMAALAGDPGAVAELATLLTEGHLSPWKAEDDTGPIAPAISAGHFDLAAKLTRLAPDILPPVQIERALDEVLQYDAPLAVATALIDRRPAAVAHMLRAAALCNRPDVYAHLLASGADPTLRDEAGRRPIDFAPDGAEAAFAAAEAESRSAGAEETYAAQASERIHTREMALYHPDAPGWEPIDDTERATTVASGFPADAVVRKRPLAFYPGTHLVLIEQDTGFGVQARSYFLEGPDHAVALDGKSQPIHEYNRTSAQFADGPPRLVIDDDNALDYLAFFCFFVRGDEGAFLLLDRADHPALPRRIFGVRGETPTRARRALDKIFQLPRYWGRAPDGRWLIHALIYYSDAIFFSAFALAADGTIEMIEDYPILQSLGAGADVDSIDRQSALFRTKEITLTPDAVRALFEETSEGKGE